MTSKNSIPFGWLAGFMILLLLTGCNQGAEDSGNAGSNSGNPPAVADDSSDPVQGTTVAEQTTPPTSSAGTMAGGMTAPAPEDIEFKDDVVTNADAPQNVAELSFFDKNGDTIRLGDYRGKENVILVFTEGFNGALCPFCQTQTSRLVANYEKFRERECEIVVVYPGPADHLDEFIEAALKTEKDQVDRVPFPIVLDPEFKATNYFDIHSMHAHPSTYLIDKDGGIQFAYVGKDMTADRPSVKFLLGKLDMLKDKNTRQ